MDYMDDMDENGWLWMEMNKGGCKLRTLCEMDEARFNNLIKDIRCPKCISGSLSSSNAPISEDLKLKIVEMIKEDKTDEEIKEYVSIRFGKESLYEPELNKQTYFLWYSPFILLFF